MKLIRTIFGSQPDGTLAGGDVFHALVSNCLLFIPCGYVTAMYISHCGQARSGENREKGSEKSWKEAILAELICLTVSNCIEGGQSITSLGMADWKDVLGNTLGGMIGMGMAEGYDFFYPPVIDAGEKRQEP